MTKLRVALVSGAALVAAWVPPAAATPPGTNGQIAFASLRDGNFEIYVMDADGSDETNLTTDSTEVYDPPGPRTARRSPSPASATGIRAST